MTDRSPNMAPLKGRVWILWAIAGSFRNTHPPAASRAFLREVGDKVRMLQENAEHHRLSPEEALELGHLLEVFGDFLIGPELWMSDPPEGTA